MTDKCPEISGYVHPTGNNYTKKSVYKTFSSNEKKDSNAFGTTIVGKTYSRQGMYEEDPCPVCKGKVTFTCPCAFSDKKCESGHLWYNDRDGKLFMGNPHKK